MRCLLVAAAAAAAAASGALPGAAAAAPTASGALPGAAAAAPAAVSSAPSFLFMLGDDIGWSDFSYMNGTAHAPRLASWLATPGTIKMLDFHSAGTVCSPTRASILTGRNHFRDCVNYVYDCSDMTECVPDFEFAPQRTFTIADAARAASTKGASYRSHFGGKWHLGSLFNNSESLGGITSSPQTHGFDEFNCTVEVAPTSTTNCQCSPDGSWPCDFGHNEPGNHCTGGPGPDPHAAPGCCFNYWQQDASSPNGVANATRPTPDDDSTYNADAFVRFLESLGGAPFVAQVRRHCAAREAPACRPARRERRPRAAPRASQPSRPPTLCVGILPQLPHSVLGYACASGGVQLVC